jgi:hypothetical protein
MQIGAMHTDEMCNFYLVFYAKKPFSFLCEENGYITNSERAPLQTQLPDTCMLSNQHQLIFAYSSAHMTFR